MIIRTRSVFFASAIAVVATFSLFGGAYLVSSTHKALAHALYWQGYWLQSLVPAANIGTQEHPLYEGNPGHIVAFFAGIPLGLVVYFLFAYAVLRFRSGPGAAQQGALVRRLRLRRRRA